MVPGSSRSFVASSTHHGRHVVVASDKLDVAVAEADGEHAQPRGRGRGRGRLLARLRGRGEVRVPLLHVELLAVPLEVRDGRVGGKGDLGH